MTPPRLVFDIETAPLPEAVDYIEPVSAPANYKDPDKINAYIEGGQVAALDKCGRDPDLCQVVAIGIWLEGKDHPEALMRDDEPKSEERILDLFWWLAGTTHLIGYNCLAFDLPVLLRRSLYLGVLAPTIALDKYRHPDVTDLMLECSFRGALRMRSLSFYAKRFGFDVPDTLTGAGIGQAFAEGRVDDIRHHVLADVRKTALLAEKFGCFSTQPVGSPVL